MNTFGRLASNAELVENNKEESSLEVYRNKGTKKT